MDPIPIVKHLSETIGIRFFGSAAEREAADYIAGQFAGRGLQPQLEPFRVMGWDLRSEPTLSITAPEPRTIAAYPLVYSLATGAGGVEGTLRYVGKCLILGVLMWDRYEVVGGDGSVAAWVIVRENGPASTMPATLDDSGMPMVVISREDGDRVSNWLAAGEEVRVRLGIDAEFTPGALSHNVIAEQPGTHPEDGYVVVCGHYDTEYNSPGAIDNASGIAGILDMVERLADAAPRRTVRYIAFGAEEPMMLGSYWHVRRLKDRGELRACAATVCLDMIACNEPTWIWATDGERRIKDLAERSANAIGIPEKYGPIEWITDPWATSDQYPFQAEGVGVMCCTWHGDTWPHTHLPSDTVAEFDSAVYNDTLDLCEPVVRDLARDL